MATRSQAASGGAPASRQQIRVVGLAIATAVIAYLCYRILLPFLPGLIWAVALAIVARPLHRALDRRLRQRTYSSLITVVVVTVIVVFPAVVVTQQVVSEAAGAIRSVQSPEFRTRISAVSRSHPRAARAVNWLQQRVDVGRQAEALARNVGAALPSGIAVSVGAITQFLVALFTMFFLLRDIEYFTGALRWLIPLPDSDAAQVLSRVQQTIDATIRGRVLIAVIQGALGGLMFWWLGLSAPILWGAVMALASLIPVLGSFIVWIPAALYLALAGSVIKALILVGWGMLVVGTADNVLFPMLVGKGLRQHTLITFFALLGGVAAFGLSGLVIGPVAFALADALLDVWSRRAPIGRQKSEDMAL